MTRLPPDVVSTVQVLQPLVQSFAVSDYGIAVGGAHAKGVQDEASDLDLYLFAETVLGSAERTRRTEVFSERTGQVVSWGEDESFEQGGTDFEFDGSKVEVWLRRSGLIEQTIAECHDGQLRRELVTWTPHGFYNHCALCDLHTMVIIDDPTGQLGQWQGAVAVYPPKLKAQIIETHLAAAGFWPGNFHYHSAIERQDTVYAAGIVQQVAHNLIQVLFAANEAYFPGDKKIEQSLARLEHLPERFVARLQELVWPGSEASVAHLRQQQQELQRLLGDVADLAEAVRS